MLTAPCPADVVAISWCGLDCVALMTAAGQLVLVNPFGELLSYDLDGVSVLAPEIDGERKMRGPTPPTHTYRGVG